MNREARDCRELVLREPCSLAERFECAPNDRGAPGVMATFSTVLRLDEGGFGAQGRALFSFYRRCVSPLEPYIFLTPRGHRPSMLNA